jgi:hypothetical protein
MLKLFIFLTFLFFQLTVTGQTSYFFEDKSNEKSNAFLENEINDIAMDHTKLIMLKFSLFEVDTLLAAKVHYRKNTKRVHITYDNGSERTVAAKYFWGQVNDYQERQRFYKGKVYVIWNTVQPYIYRTYGVDDEINYFFSEDLLSPILPLTNENISRIEDPLEVRRITNYLNQNNTHYWHCKHPYLKKIETVGFIPIELLIVLFNPVNMNPMKKAPFRPTYHHNTFTK